MENKSDKIFFGDQPHHVRDVIQLHQHGWRGE
jgi:hypothetical protein